ncbi:sex peptide receptor-like [Gigantopelta aegis]|uniref:sex peptide receptor-like n=1 Tax=Gigantopelta aegis TaxID=1735272 RepID=UPI001B88B6C4|nr:sex peptide receptor-like [Gigantopelta aegis]
MAVLYSNLNSTNNFVQMTLPSGPPTTIMSAYNITEAFFSPSGDTNCSDVKYIDGIVSRATAQGLREFAMNYANYHGYFSATVCVFGIIANIANVLVLTRKNMISPTNTILMWLAVADLLTMLSYLPFSIHFYILKIPSFPTFTTMSFVWICFLMFHASFSIICHTVAIWLTIALAIFRYIYICMPTKGAVYCNLHRARIAIFLVYLSMLLLCIPNIIINRFERISLEPLNLNMSMDVNSTNDTFFVHVYKPTLWSDTEVARVFRQINNWIQAIFIKLIPCAMLMTLTILLIHAMHKAHRKRMLLKSQGRKAESDKHGEHNRTTKMLLAVVVLFMITELPQGLLTLMNIFIRCFQDVVYNPLGDLLDIMALINNSVNFVLYCTMSKQFRDTFASVFCTFCAKHRPGWLKLKLVNSPTSTNGNVTQLESATNHTYV